MSRARPSLTVLLFKPLSEDDGDHFLSVGITSEIIAKASNVRDLRVSSKISSMQFESGQDDISKAAKKLNSNYVLTGGLSRHKEHLKVTATLWSIKTHSEIWSETYEHALDDIFELQEDIAKCIVGAVLGEVKFAEISLAGSTPDRKLNALGLVYKAHHFWLTSFSLDGILKACDYLRQAIDREPNYSRARATLAMLLAQQISFRICKNHEACAKEAREQIEVAFRQAPNDTDVLENAGVVWQTLGERERATFALRKATELAPLNLTTQGYLAQLLGVTGGQAGALEAQQLIYKNFSISSSHPYVAYWNYYLAVAEQSLGNHEMVIELCEQSLIGQPQWIHSYFVMANTYFIVDQEARAKAALAQASKINSSLTPQLYSENIKLITGDNSRSDPFLNGYSRFGLI